MSDATEPVQFKNDNYNYQNAYVAEKQKAEMTSSEVIGPSFRISTYAFLLFSFSFLLIDKYSILN
mgnify:CR=1 FL=1